MAPGSFSITLTPTQAAPYDANMWLKPLTGKINSNKIAKKLPKLLWEFDRLRVINWEKINLRATHLTASITGAVMLQLQFLFNVYTRAKVHRS